MRKNAPAMCIIWMECEGGGTGEEGEWGNVPEVLGMGYSLLPRQTLSTKANAGHKERLIRLSKCCASDREREGERGRGSEGELCPVSKGRSSQTEQVPRFNPFLLLSPVHSTRLSRHTLHPLLALCRNWSTCLCSLRLQFVVFTLQKWTSCRGRK